MGAQNSNLRKSIEDDFMARTDDTGRGWLRLDELLALRVNCGLHWRLDCDGCQTLSMPASPLYGED